MPEITLFSEMAPADLFQNNAFRITELPVDASAQEISRHLAMVQMRMRLGENDLDAAPPIDKRVPAVEEVRAAVERLRDPQRRLLDELFWYWPTNGFKGSSDPILTALARGAHDHARQAWFQALATENASIARHNLAVLALAGAFDRNLTTGTVSERAPDGSWDEALARWNEVIRDDRFWAHLGGLMAARNEPQLTAHLARQIRNDLPVFVAGINAQLAVRAVQQATEEKLRALRHPADKASASRAATFSAEVERQRQVLARSPFDRVDVDRAIRQALRPVRQRLKGLCRSVSDIVPGDYGHPALQDGLTALTLFRYVQPLPLNDKDRDNLQEDVAPALYKFCWFCQRRIGEFGYSKRVFLNGRVTRQKTPRGP
jgi:hypothetical protein